MEFKGKTVIVTGAANGIGQAIARMFSLQGANIVIADNDEENGKELMKELLVGNPETIFVKTDVSAEEDVANLFLQAKARFKSIDILINNAGISKFVDLFEMTSSNWDKIIGTNLKSVFLCSQQAATYMKSSGGHIVNISSTRAFMSEPNTEAYSASKGGIISLTHALARTLSKFKIKVNSISPGWIQNEDYDQLSEKDHEQHLSNRVGQPEDVARCCLFLCNELNDFITAENIIIDGGMTRKMIYED